MSVSRSYRFGVVGLSLMVVVLASACGGNDSIGPGGGTGNGGGNGNGGGGGTVPAELVGKWSYGSISPTNFYDDHTGQYSGNAYGVGAWFTFTSTGTFDEFVYQYVQNYGCQTQIWTRMKGRMDESNGVIRFYPTTGDYKVADTCIAAHNYQRPMTSAELAGKQGDQWAWGFEVNQYDGKTYLMLGGVGGQAYPFAGQ